MLTCKIDEILSLNEISADLKARIKEFLSKNDLKNLELGSHSLGDGNCINVFEYETKDAKGVFEWHKKYIDIHVILSGKEIVQKAEKIDEITTPFDVDGDYELDNAVCTEEVMIDGTNCVFFKPYELHMAGIKVGGAEKVKKAVFKLLP